MSEISTIDTSKFKFYKKIQKHYDTKCKDTMDKLIEPYVVQVDGNIVNISKDNKLELSSEYEHIGQYDKLLSMWFWSWGNNYVEKVKNNKNIRLFYKYVENNSDKFENTEAEIYHYLSINNSFYISESNIEFLLKFVLYLTNSKGYISYTNDNTIKYLIVKNH